MTADQLWAIAKGEMECPECKFEPCPKCTDINGSFIPCNECRRKIFDRGECPCERMKALWVEFCRHVGKHEQFINLKKLTPYEGIGLSVARQAKILAGLQAAPEASYAFFGPAGTGKTTFCVGLYLAALVRKYQKAGKAQVWRVSAKKLLDDFVAEATRKENFDGYVVAPEVNRDRIVSAARQGLRPCLFIEEIDKVKYTEFKTNALFEVIDAIYENGGQLVLNTNVPFDKLALIFGTEENGEPKDTSAAITRRIMETCEVIDFFSEEQD